MPGLIESIGGATPKKQVNWGSILVENYFEGMFTNRHPLAPAGNIAEQRFYGGRQGALIDGLNVEILDSLAIGRRPGLQAFSTVLYPTVPLTAFSMPLLDGSIRVLVDTGSIGNLAVSSV